MTCSLSTRRIRRLGTRLLVRRRICVEDTFADEARCHQVPRGARIHGCMYAQCFVDMAKLQADLHQLAKDFIGSHAALHCAMQ